MPAQAGIHNFTIIEQKLMPHCIHYGACGGCAVDNRAAIDKTSLLASALSHAGFSSAPVSPIIEIPLRSRRRVDLAATRIQGNVSLGLHRARSADVIDMTECVLLAPHSLALLPPLRVLLRSLEAFRRTGSVIMNLVDSGPDILLRLDADATGPDRAKLITFARAHNAPRISIAKGAEQPEPVAVLSMPFITLSGIAVEPPPAAFLQASRAGEAAIIAATIAGLPKLRAKARIVELYAGIGTISFALAPYGRIEAYEGAGEAVAAQDRAIRHHHLAGRMNISARDLNRRPLKISEMVGSAVIVLDPPYAGAGAQMKNLAASGVPRIIYVSCNPQALANDAFALHRAGYEILSATPIDQFPYSENLESIIVFIKNS